MSTPKISVVLAHYNRPEALQTQVDAIWNQTIQPHETIIAHVENGATEDYNFEDFQVVRFSQDPGLRFKFIGALATDSDSDFVAIFDSDNIPGKKALENFYKSYLKKEGLYGSLGCKFVGDYYEHEAGRPKPNEELEEVDFVGQTLFFPYHYLPEYFKCPCWLPVKSGEDDLWFSYLMDKKGINRYVPPHPKDDKELWPAKEKRTEGTAFSQKYEKHEEDRRKIIKHWRD